MSQEPIFALDIGTRNVVGLLAVSTVDGLKVLDCHAIEHESRAMKDGQVHDVEAVAKVVTEIKITLEKRNSLKLSQAAVAAAGRSLKTIEITAGIPLDPRQEISPREIRTLEMEAATRAMEQVSEYDYHCAGYSVIRFLLDGTAIDNPVAQRGHRLEASVIITFLPRIVTDALLSVLDRSGLEASNLTLEPIAALNAAVPPGMRLLNLALIDIGAGTSDIAITREGTVVGYGMVPTAGDAISEVISQHYLLDFNTAESIKLQLSQKTISCQDVLGQQLEIAGTELREVIRPVTEKLAKLIVDEIKRLNNQSPKAILLVGGGSLIPDLGTFIAQYLEIPENRIATRGLEIIPNLVVDEKSATIHGPMGVTPVGIAHAAMFHPGFRLMTVWIDEHPVRLLDLGTPKVADALVTAGINSRQLLGRAGTPLTVILNGAPHTFPGTPATPGKILRGKKEIGLDDALEDGDRLSLVAATDGGPASVKLEEVLADFTRTVTVGDRLMAVPPEAHVNGKAVPPKTKLAESDVLVVRNTVGNALRFAEIELAERTFQITLNGESQEIPIRRIHPRLNGRPTSPTAEIKDGDVLAYTIEEQPLPTFGELLPQSGEHQIPFFLNGFDVELPVPGRRLTSDGVTLHADTPIFDRADVTIEPDGGLILADVMPLIYSELAQSPTAGKTLSLTIDGDPAEFTSPITPHCQIETRWVDIRVKGGEHD